MWLPPSVISPFILDHCFSPCQFQLLPPLHSRPPCIQEPTALLWWHRSHSPHYTPSFRLHLPPFLTHPWASTCQTQIKSHLLRKASQTTVNLLTSSFHKGLRFYFLQQIIQPVMSQASWILLPLTKIKTLLPKSWPQRAADIKVTLACRFSNWWEPALPSSILTPRRTTSQWLYLWTTFSPEASQHRSSLPSPKSTSHINKEGQLLVFASHRSYNITQNTINTNSDHFTFFQHLSPKYLYISLNQKL